MPMPDEHYILDDNKYVADILQDFKAAKGRDYQSKVLFKKRMFRETDETITEPQFITLSYVQVSSCQCICQCGRQCICTQQQWKTWQSVLLLDVERLCSSERSPSRFGSEGPGRCSSATLQTVA